MVYRTAKTTRSYKKRQKHLDKVDRSVCPFCEIDNTVTKIIGGGKHFFIMENSFPYEIWDAQRVISHLMIVPKRHVVSVSKFNDQESREFHKLVSEYENNEYSIYYRHAKNVLKSVDHQHTHLLKLYGKKHKLSIFIKKPYILFFK